MPRVDNRCVISGIIHVLRSGCRWKDAPKIYGPHKTLYTALCAEQRKVYGNGSFIHLADAGGPPAALMIDATHIKAYGSAAGGKRGAEAQAIGRSRGGRTSKIHAAVDEQVRPRRLIVRAGHRGDAPVALQLIGQMTPPHCLADAAQDSDAFRLALIQRGTILIIPNNPTRSRFHPFDRSAYRMHNVIARTFSRLKDFRRLATRYDKHANNFLATVYLLSLVCYCL